LNYDNDVKGFGVSYEGDAAPVLESSWSQDGDGLLDEAEPDGADALDERHVEDGVTPVDAVGPTAFVDAPTTNVWNQQCTSCVDGYFMAPPEPLVNCALNQQLTTAVDLDDCQFR